MHAVKGAGDLRDFVTACESYVPETFLKVDWHNCMIMAVPEEQKLIAAQHASRR